VGNSLLGQGKGARSWSTALKKLRELDWHRSSSMWEGRAVIGGRVSKSAANVLLTTAAMRTVMGLPLPPDEQRAEDAFRGGDK
jgi:DNA sulfur modification protein DndB